MLMPALVPLVAAAFLGPAAAPPIEIDYVLYDSPGSDNGSNTSLNAEYVKVVNNTTATVSLTKWTLRDTSGHVYTFPTYSLPAKGYVYIRSGKGTNSSKTLYWQQTWYVWNNTGDTAYLRDSKGTLKDTCTWNGIGSSTSC